MSTIAGKFKVTTVPIPKEVLDELAGRLNLPENVRKKLEGALIVEKIPDEEYTVEIRDKDQLIETIKTKL